MSVSDKWMGSTTQHQGEKASSIVQSRVEKDNAKESEETKAKLESLSRCKSFAPPSQSASDLARSHSMSVVMKKDSEEAKDDDTPLDPREECLVTVPDAIVHLVDDQQSPHLATAHFSVVRITQKGNGIVVLVRVGEDLHWPLMKDMPTVKLDPTHYFFTLPVPSSIDAPEDESKSEGHCEKNGFETLNYGVTFPDPSNHEQALHELDSLLATYTSFSSPTLVQGDQRKEEFAQTNKHLSLNKKEKTETDVATRVNEGNKDYRGKLVPKKVLSGEEQQVTVTEENQSAFWTTMAPNVDDYGSSAARAIATGSGHVIRGIFWVRDSTVAQLESGTLYLQSKMNPLDKPSNISPRTLRNLKRVRDMSRATENVARSVLLGIVKTAGFFSGSLIKSRAGKKVFKLMPGEVALVSLDAFGKLFDAVEKATSDVLESTSLMTQNVIAHRYGESAGQVTQDTFATAGHVVATAWTVAKLRNALNPKAGARPLTKTGVIKGLAKNVVKGKQPTT